MLLGKVDKELTKITEFLTDSDVKIICEFELGDVSNGFKIHSRNSNSTLWVSESLMDHINNDWYSAIRYQVKISDQGIDFNIFPNQDKLVGELYVIHNQLATIYRIG